MSSPEQGSNWIENGCIKMVFIWSTGYPSNIVRYNSTAGRFKTWALSGQKDKWDSLAYYLRQNRDFLNLVGNCQIPILTQNAWQDKFFNTLGIIRSAYILPFNNIKMYFGAMDGHGSDYDDDEEQYKSNICSDWLEYYLNGVNNNVMDAAKKFTYACSTFPVNDRNFWTWQRYDSPVWPPSGIQNVRLYLHPDNKLQVFGYSGSQATVNFLNDVIDTNVTLDYLVNTEFRGPYFDSKFHKSEIYFDTPALLADATLAGTPTVYLNYTSSSYICQYNFQLWDVRPNGDEKLVTRVNFTDRNYTANQNRQVTVSGQSYSHIFRAGDKIRIKLNNLDNVPMYTSNGDTTDFFLRTNPFVLPVTKRATNRVYINNNLRTYIDLPLKNFIIGIKPISSEVPAEFKLFQNNPNPFNPVTKIRFSIPLLRGVDAEGGRGVSLIIYDILGREVEILVNEQLQPGTFEVNWDGTKYSSGVYFYRLVARDFTQTNKMVMVK
jgi:predicted acyl esterase